LTLKLFRPSVSVVSLFLPVPEDLLVQFLQWSFKDFELAASSPQKQAILATAFGLKIVDFVPGTLVEHL